MTHQTTTYNNSGIINLLSFKEGMGKVLEVRRVFLLFLIMMVMGVGSAWAQDPTPSKWDGTVATKFASGSGTQANPYIISNAAELAYFGSQMNGKTWYVELAADIDLNNREWTYGKNSATNFKGHFNGEHDGVKHTITNLKIVPTSAKNNGLFSSLQGTAASRAEVKNLIIDGVTISQTGNLAATTTSGALAGNVTEYTDIDNVTVKNVSISFANLTNANYVGGFVGRVQQNNCKITNCTVESPSISVTGSISGAASYIGGAIAYVAGSNNLLSTIDGLTVKSPSVTINKVAIKDCYIGAVFGRLNTFFTVDDVEVSDPTLTYNNAGNDKVALNLGTFAGGFAGNTTKEVSVTNVTVKGTAQLTLGTETNKASTEVKSVKAGLIGYTTTNVRLEDWTVEKSNVQVYGKLTSDASNIGAFAGNLTGVAGGPTTVKNIKINKDGTEPGCNLNVTGDVEIACLGIGGFAGTVTTNIRLEGCEVTKPTVTIGGDINTATSYIGGAIGYFLGAAGNTSYINGFTVNEPKVDINTITYKDQCIGAVFGRIHNYSDVTGVTVSSPSLTYKATGNPGVALNLGSFAGYIIGTSAQETRVTNITTTGNAQLIIGTDAAKATTEIKAVNAGFVGMTTTNVRFENWDVSNSNVQVYGSLTTTADYLGGLGGRMESSTSAPLTLKNVKITGNSNVNVTGDVKTGSYLGGFAGYIGQGTVTYSTISIDGAGVNGTATVSVGGNVTAASYAGGFVGRLLGKGAAGNSVQADNVKVGTTDLTINGQTTAASYYGGLAGQVTTACTLNGWSITTASKLTFNGNITALSYVGGAIGSLEGAAGYPSSATGFEVKGLDIDFNCNLTNGLYVGGVAGLLTAVAQANKIEKSSASGKIHTTGSHTFVRNKTFAVGGIVGYTIQTSTTFTEVNNCVSEVDFNLSGYTPSDVSGSLYNLQQNGFVIGGVIGRINTPYRLPESLYYSGKIYAPFAMVGPIVGVFLQNIGAAAYAYNDYSAENLNAAVVPEMDIKEQNWYFNSYQIGLSSAVSSQALNTTASPTTVDGVSYLAIGESTLTNFNSISGATKHSKTILAYTASGAGGINPAWNTNSATYPAYYMYYMQGVNRGVYVEDSQVETIKAQVLSGAFVILTLTDGNANFNIAANRGIITHTMTATASAADSFKWYVDGVEQTGTTTATCEVKPQVVGSTVRVEAIKGGYTIKSVECKVNSVPRVGKSLGTPTTYGTKDNPYLIGSAEELQLLSYLSTLPTTTVIEQDFTSANHYNRAYYKMDADIDLSEVDNFIPISFAAGYGSNGMIRQDYVFCGDFDGDKHKISGLKEEWYGGVININDSYTGWGLFSIVGGPSSTIKVGDTSASVTLIKNLIIDGATLTHRTGNVTFYYNNNTANNNASSSSCIGVLAGIVSGNTKIDNIEIRNSKITDEGSSNYSLATRGLYVGGAVGSIQNAFNDAVNVATSTKIQHVAAQVDITLEKPIFADATAKAQVGLFNIGGIIGRICATGATQTQVKNIMPAYTFYSGDIVAPKAWISPVLASVRYADQQSGDFTNFSKHWDGNNNTTGTQLAITNAQYYNYRINGKLITPLYPVDACALGVARPIMRHRDGAETQERYDASLYQGVNYSARFIDSEGTTLKYLCASPTDKVYWKWEEGFPHITTETYKGAYITVSGHEITVKPESITPSKYRWQVSYDGETWQDIEDDDATSSPYSVMPSSKDTRLFVAIVTASDGKEYRTQAEVILRVYSLFNPYISKSGDATNGYTFTLNWKDVKPSKEYSASYQWYKADKTTSFTGQTGTSLTLSQSELDAAGGYIWCQVKVQEKGEIISKWMLVAGDLNVVYVNGNDYTGNGAKTGIDTNDGRTPQTPVKTIDKANSLLDGGPMEKNIIVVMGLLNPGTDEAFRSKGTNPATLTGKWDGVNYEGQIRLYKTSETGANNTQSGSNGFQNYVKGDTKFEYLTIRANKNSDDNNFLDCHGNDVWFGKGLVMTNFSNLGANHGNLNSAQKVPELTILMTATNLSEADIQTYTNRNKPQTLTIESGHYGRIMAGRFTQAFFKNDGNTSHTILGSAAHPLWAVINVDIDKDNQMTDGGSTTYTCDINCIIAGLTDGSMYGDYEINVHGGKVEYVVGGNQGNPAANGSKTFYQLGGNSGDWGQWPNASFYGRSVINVEQDTGLKDITIGNLYAGGLGRDLQSSGSATVVDMYMYGQTEINMKSGTITGNVYGGGAGGVIGLNPWDMHLPYATTDADDATNAVINKVQYGTWGSMAAGSPLTSVTLHKPDGNGGYTTTELDLSESSTTLNISGGTINGSVYGGGCGFVNNMPDKVAMQGVGSVFGTSNVNVSGGTIHGSVYGGSEGNKGYHNKVNNYGQTINHIAEMNGTVNLTITGTEAQYPTIVGSVYGAGMGIETVGAEEYLRIATAGNNELSTQFSKDYSTNINILINMPESVEFPNDIYGGGALGKVDGTTNIILKQGKFTGNIYGGGYGELNHRDKAMVTGNTYIYTGDSVFSKIDRELPVSVEPGETNTPTVYGGGNMAQVTGNTYINLWHGNITADVYGGGRGLSEAQSAGYTGYGWVNGNTRVLYNNTTEGNKLIGNIYGGGALGAVVGQGEGQDKGTTVVIKAGEIEGDVFGGGKGEVGSDKAKVTGNTNVIVDSEWTEPTPEPEPQP